MPRHNVVASFALSLERFAEVRLYPTGSDQSSVPSERKHEIFDFFFVGIAHQEYSIAVAARRRGIAFTSRHTKDFGGPGLRPPNRCSFGLALAPEKVGSGRGSPGCVRFNIPRESSATALFVFSQHARAKSACRADLSGVS